MSWSALILFLLSISSFAESLEPIEVKTTKDIERFTFSSSETITSEELEQSPTGLIGTALEKIPGIVANQNGGPGGRMSFFIRGTESRHISFTIDGLKVNDPSNTDRQFDTAFMTSPFMKEVTIHKSPQAVLYGSDALGGMIEMRTRKGEHAPETRLSVNAGSFSTIDTSLSKDWKEKNNHNGTLTVSRFHTDGFSRLNKKRFNAKERDAADITQVTSSSEHRWAPRFQTDFLTSFLHGKADQDGFAMDNSKDYSQNDQYILQQKTHYEISKSQVLALRNGFNRHQRHNESLASHSEFFDGQLLQNEVIHRLELGSVGFLSGASVEKESAKAIDLDRSFDLYSAFLQTSFIVNKLKLHTGARVDEHSKYGTFTTGSGGISYEGFSLQYSQGYKAPSLYQLYGPDSFGSKVGNPELVPEINHSWEAAWKKKKDMFEGGLAVFQNRLSNQFTFSFGQGYLNQQRYIAEGVELHGKVKTALLEFSSSFTHQQFKNEETPILRRPYNMAMVGLSYFPVETIELNATGRWFSSRKDLDSNGAITKLNGYEVLDFGVRKTWLRDDVGIQLKNVLNREYEDIYGFSVMPRAVFAHYGHRF